MADVVASRIVILATTNAKKATADVIGLDKATDKAGASALGASKNFSLMKAALPLVAIGAFIGVVKKSINALKEQQAAEAQLNAVLKSTAGVAGLTSTELKNLASSLQGVTTFGDEAIIRAESLLLTFTKVGRDVFPRATETILNLSQALGQDLKSSTVQVGKALNDPVQGITALRRVGVQLTESQENLIKQFVAVGDIAKAQGVILDELETQFGGAARAAAQTLGGALTQLENVAGDLFEQLGFGFSDDFTAQIQAITKEVAKAGPIFNEIGQVFGGIMNVLFELGSVIATFTKAIFSPFFDTAEEGTGTLKILATILNQVAKAIKFLGPAFKFLGKVIGNFIFGLARAFSGILKGVAQVALKFRQLGNVLENSGVISAETAQKIRNLSTTIVNATGFQTRYINGQLTLVKAQKQTNKELVQASQSFKNVSASTKEATSNVLEILAAAGDVTAQITLLNQKYAEQRAIVEKAGLDTAILDKFYQSQRQEQLNQFLNKIITDESSSFSQRQAQLDTAYQSLLESDALNYEARLEAQRAYTEQSQALEQSRLQSIADATQRAANIATAGVNVFQKVSDLQSALAEREIEKLKQRGATEEEIEAKSRELARKQAKRAKSIGITNAIINTAVAVTQALSSPAGFPANFILAALAATAGAIEIATIAATPIPAGQFGLEGIVPPGNSADSGLVRVNQGERVNVTPARFSSPEGGSGGGFPKQVIFMVDGREFNAFIVDSMNKNLNNGKLQIRRKGVVKTA